MINSRTFESIELRNERTNEMCNSSALAPGRIALRAIGVGVSSEWEPRVDDHGATRRRARARARRRPRFVGTLVSPDQARRFRRQSGSRGAAITRRRADEHVLVRAADRDRNPSRSPLHRKDVKRHGGSSESHRGAGLLHRKP